MRILREDINTIRKIKSIQIQNEKPHLKRLMPESPKIGGYDRSRLLRFWKRHVELFLIELLVFMLKGYFKMNDLFGMDFDLQWTSLITQLRSTVCKTNSNFSTQGDRILKLNNLQRE